MAASKPIDLRQRITFLEQRVEHLELRAGIAEEPSREPLPPPALIRTPAYPARSEVPSILPTIAPAPPAPAPRRESWDIERLIAGRWYAFIGALVVVIGLGLFLKLGFDRGWFHFPPTLRCLGVAGFGFVLLGLAEWVRRTTRDDNGPGRGAIAAAGLNMAGLGAIYIASYAAYPLYKLVDPTLSFILLAATAALGIAVASRARLVSVAVISLLAGYLAPILFFDLPTSWYTLPVYLLSLLTVGLALSVLRGGMFSKLRPVVWWGTVLLGSLWVLDNLTALPEFAVFFLVAVWTAIHAELIIASRRHGLAPPTRRWPPRAWPAVRPIASSFSTSTWAVGLAVLVLRNNPQLPPDYLAPAAVAAATACIAMVLGGHLRVLRDRPITQAQRLGAALAMQCGAAVIAAVALAFAGWMEAACWLALGLSAVAAGRWLRARGLEIYGAVALTIGAARIVLYDSWSGLAATGDPFLGLYLTRWTAMMAAAGAAWLLAAYLVRPGRHIASGLKVAAAGLGAILLGASLMHIQIDPASLCIAWLALAAALAACRALAPGLMLDSIGFGVCAAAGGAWLVAYQPVWPGDAPLLQYPGFWMGLAVAGTMSALGWWAARDRPAGSHTRRTALQASQALSLIVLLAATSLEVARTALHFSADATTQRAAVSIWWGIFGVAMILAGFAARITPARHAGLALLGVATAKALLFDLVGVPPEWRVASFIGLGSLMLGVAVLYTRISARLLAPREFSQLSETTSSH